MNQNYSSDVAAVDALREKYQQLRNEIGKVIIGQDQVVKDSLISIFSNGHCLLVGVPGLAKNAIGKYHCSVCWD
jgi:MoxR-like ATPase